MGILFAHCCFLIENPGCAAAATDNENERERERERRGFEIFDPLPEHDG